MEVRCHVMSCPVALPLVAVGSHRGVYGRCGWQFLFLGSENVHSNHTTDISQKNLQTMMRNAAVLLMAVGCAAVTPVSNKCETDATCPEGTWCRAVHDTASGQGCLVGKECVPFVQKGETCGGFVLPCYHDQCAAGLECECSEPTCDVPGTCVDATPAFCADKGPFCGRGFDECKPGYTCTFDPTCTPDEIATDRCSSCCVRDEPAFCADKGPVCGAGLEECKEGYTCTVDPTCTTGECASCCVLDEPSFCDDKGPFCGRGFDECKPGYTCTFDPTCTPDEIATDRCSSCCVRDEPAFCADKGPVCGAGLEKCKEGYTCTVDPTCTGKDCGSCCVFDEVTPCCLAHPVCKEGFTQKKKAKCNSKDEKKCYIEELCCKKIACRRIKKGWDQYLEFGHDEE